MRPAGAIKYSLLSRARGALTWYDGFIRPSELVPVRAHIPID